MCLCGRDGVGCEGGAATGGRHGEDVDRCPLGLHGCGAHGCEVIIKQVCAPRESVAQAQAIFPYFVFHCHLSLIRAVASLSPRRLRQLPRIHYPAKKNCKVSALAHLLCKSHYIEYFFVFRVCTARLARTWLPAHCCTAPQRSSGAPHRWARGRGWVRARCLGGA